MLDHEAVARGWRRLSDVLTSSPPAFNAINGMGFFDWIRADLMQRSAGVLQRSYSSAGLGNLTMPKPWATRITRAPVTANPDTEHLG